MSCGIYRYQNLITLKSYIGQSTNLEERNKRHHREYINGITQFYQSLQKWGWDNFSYEILELCKRAELNEREIYWINYYDSYFNGYNETKGGGNRWAINEDKIIELYNKNYTPKEIASKLQISLTSVYKYLSTNEDFIKHKNEYFNENNIIYQYDLQGNFIRSWSSKKAAARELNIFNTAIGKVIMGERISAGGFLWRNYYIEKIPDNQLKNTWKKHKVNQYDKNLNFIQSFESAAEAARSLGNKDPSLIRRACRKGFEYSAYGYKWAFVNEEN